MKWVLAAFTLLVSSASAVGDDGRSDNDSDRGLRGRADERFLTSGAHHGGQSKHHKQIKNESIESIMMMYAEEVISSVETEFNSTAASTSSLHLDYSDSDDYPDSDGNTQKTQKIVRSSNNLSNKNLHVSHLYTYGAPSVMKGPAMSNPDNACVPGLRIYTEDFKINTCSWYNFLWCTPGEEITDVDFASQINVKAGYPHPKMATLVLRRQEGGSKSEYVYRACRDYENAKQYGHQWWPAADHRSDMLPGRNVHSLVDHYEPRLMQVPYNIRGPSLEYTSAANCVYKSSYAEIRDCLNNYSRRPNNIGGVARSGWETFAHMTRQTQSNMAFMKDSDTVYVLKNDQNKNYRKCIIGFQGSDGVSDLAGFILDATKPTGYCGRYGVHTGVKNELWKITHDSKYANVIKPALETCHEVTCVGHSLGGSICNVFTMCANNGLQNLNGSKNSQMWDDYNALIWKALS